MAVDAGRQVATLSMWGKYIRQLEQKPIQTKMLTACFVQSFGFLLSQAIAGVKKIEWKRLLDYLLVVIILQVPVGELWYNRGGLSTLCGAVGVTSVQRRSPRLGVFLTAVTDQFTYGIFFNACFMVLLGIFNGEKLKESVDGMLERILSVTRQSCSFWIPATFGALSVQPALQMPALNVFGLIWSIWAALQQLRHDNLAKKNA
eukprot:TRINITY_DN45430_c0_g1_i1.p2 TRINITY_DN45430_c0_g1~~TRINITY_DN45430_c0_g1_i1.p2  ORF type:complete len:203 (-),score=34.37 TRINITY_DN45430_c0_g1_i1:61-669(-)